MANPFADSRTFHRVGHVTNTVPLRLLPTPRGIAVITTTGRKTGKARTRAMRAVRDGAQVYAVALLGNKTDWLANARANPEVTVKLGTKTHRARAREVTDADERAKARRAYHPVAGWYDYFDYANFVWSLPTKAKLLAAHDGWFDNGVVVAFDLDEDADGANH
jgi:deazaflavin-dependent oxidoreductase (nitroreductase family)